MTNFELDRHFGGTPCLCGDVGTWHPSCYAGKSDAQVAAAYRTAYAWLRARLALERKTTFRAVMNKVTKGGHSE